MMFDDKFFDDCLDTQAQKVWSFATTLRDYLNLYPTHPFY